MEWWQRELPASFYDHFFERPWPASTYLPIYRWIASKVEEPVLDVGCGEGSLARILYANGIRQYLGIDFSEVAIRRASDSLPLSFEVGDARLLDYSRMAGYRTVVLCELLEHIAPDLELLSRVPATCIVLGSLPRGDGWGHVRFFPTMEQVLERYGKVLLFKEFVPMETQWWCFNARRR